MPLDTPARLVRELTRRGYNADREAVTLLAETADPAGALEAAVDAAPDDALVLTTAHVREALDGPNAADAVVTDDRSTAGSTPDDPAAVAEAPDSTSAVAEAPDDSSAAVENSSGGGDAASAVDDAPSATDDAASTAGGATPVTDDTSSTADSTPTPNADAPSDEDPSVSGGTGPADTTDEVGGVPVETKGSSGSESGAVSAAEAAGRGSAAPAATADADVGERTPSDPERREVAITGDITGHSTGTGEYDEFVATFRDRYERLAAKLRGRVNHRPAESVAEMPGGSEAGLIGLVDDVRSTANGHWIVDLEDTTGTFPCLVTKDRDLADLVDLLLLDECIAVEGRLSDDAGVLFADSLHFPDVPRTFQPSTADREVSAALISDVHVGSQEFHGEAWDRFADWLHTAEADHVEYLLVAGDMVEGVGVYPDQDEELDIIDIYDQYEAFAERLKRVPGDMEVVMIPGNHDAVRLAEPQPGFDEELRDIMSAHDARIVGNPSTVTLEGVSVLMYHGVSLDEVIAELPEDGASYDRPHEAMYQLLRKRHVAPQYGGHMRLAPEERDHLVIDEVPDVFHTGHVHKLGYGKYHNVLAINSGCWQSQTAFQESVNIDPDVGFAPILDLDTLDLTVRDFAP